MDFKTLIYLTCILASASPAVTRAVTHEDIKDAIISLVHMFRDLTDKLERHEYRERQLGEQLKKALSGLDKRERQQDSRLDAIISSLSSMEQRMQAIESSGKMAEKEMYTVDTGHLQSWMESLEGKLNGHDGSKDLGHFVTSMEGAMANRYDSLEREILRIADEIRSMSAKLGERGSTNGEDLGGKIEEAASRLESRITEQIARFDATQAQIDLVKNEVSQRGDLLFAELLTGFQKIHTDVKSISQVEQLLVQTADYVMDTKKRVEYGVHQILLEVSELIRNQGKDISSTVNIRFDDISAKILENQSEGMTNLSRNVENQMSQVWRQIGIMYKELSASAGALDTLQKQTESYVNNSLTSMDGMKGTVGLIKGRMNEVTENLNYLLGRLSLVTQEFNLTKNALAQALDGIRASFKEVREKVDTPVGPGPNPISDNSEGDVDNRLP